MKKTSLVLGFMLIMLLAMSTSLMAQVTVSGAHASSNGTYSTLKLAFDAINGQTQTGYTIIVSITANTTETSTAALNAGAWTSLTISPSGGAAKRIYSSAIYAAVVRLNGADNVTINGLNSGGNSLTIENSRTESYVCTVEFTGEATNNSITNCDIKGSVASTTNQYGVIRFYSGTNSNNQITYCNIGPSGSNKPSRGIVSYSGTNNSNTIDHCNIYDFYHSGNHFSGVEIASGSAWTITNNSFYQTSSISTGNYGVYPIYISTGDGYTITGNYIGGREANCGGPAMTITGSLRYFYGICFDGSGLLNANTNSIQGNEISNISLTSSYTSAIKFYGIYVDKGKFNIGNSSGNTIGSSTGTGSISITFSNTSSFHYVYGIYANSADVSIYYISNSSIGSFTLNANNLYFRGIEATSVNLLDYISNNTIGSTSTANSIYFSISSANAPLFYGIYTTTASSGNETINSNVVANLTINSTTDDRDGTSIGIITSSSGTQIIDNEIYNLSSGLNGDGNNSSHRYGILIGIYMTSSTGSVTIRGNTIYNLSSTNTTGPYYNAITGICKSNSTGSSVIIENNFIYAIKASKTNTTFYVCGISQTYGDNTIRNNIVALGFDENGSSLSQNYFYEGIYVYGLSNSSNIYFNTVYIGGTGTGGASNSYACRINDNGNSNDTRNNIFVNARTNSGGSGSHYAISGDDQTNLTINYNNYFVSGTGGVLGYFNFSNRTTILAWQTATGQDGNSLNIDPLFVNASGSYTVDSDFKVQNSSLSGAGVTISGITTDYSGYTRSNPPSLGGVEYDNPLPVELSSFTAQFLNNTPTLYWTTQSETDNMGWFVYRNIEEDFTTSEKISQFIEGHGTTTQQQSYLYEDRIQNPEVGDRYYYWLESIDYSGLVNHYDKVAILTIPDQHDPGGGLIPEPEIYGLLQNEPNPFIESTKISFNLHKTARVELNVYNLKGQLVKTLFSGVTSKHTVIWDGKDENGKQLENGVYLYKLLINGKTAETKKLILMR